MRRSDVGVLCYLPAAEHLYASGGDLLAGSSMPVLRAQCNCARLPVLVVGWRPDIRQQMSGILEAGV